MFCSKCGKENNNGAKFCANCGAPLYQGTDTAFNRTVNNMSNSAENIASGARDAFTQAGSSIDTEISGLAHDLRGDNPAGGPLRTDRSLISYILLSIVTCGIYGYYWIYTVARDINTACDDGDETAGLGMFILLSIVTCGIYGYYWEYKVANRIQANAPRYGINIQENGTSILMWRIFGMFICLFGTYFGSYILIKNINAICSAYNRAHGFNQ